LQSTLNSSIKNSTNTTNTTIAQTSLQFSSQILTILQASKVVAGGEIPIMY